MEGKEHYEDDDDKRKSDSSDDSDYFEDKDSDEFGLPEMEDADHSYKKESDDTFTSDYSSDSDYTTSSDTEVDESEYTYREEDEYEDTPAEVKNYNVHGLDDDERSGPGAGLIVFLIIILIGAIGFGVWYFMFRTPEPPPPSPVTQPVEVAPDTVYDEPEPEPIIKDDPSSVVAGTVTQLNSPTGRYYVVIASFVDDDLAMDYGNKLAKQGTGTTLLSPKKEKGFYRLAIADFQSLKDAALSAEEAKSTFGNDVWVIRY